MLDVGHFKDYAYPAVFPCTWESPCLSTWSALHTPFCLWSGLWANFSILESKRQGISFARCLWAWETPEWKWFTIPSLSLFEIILAITAFRCSGAVKVQWEYSDLNSSLQTPGDNMINSKDTRSENICLRGKWWMWKKEIFGWRISSIVPGTWDPTTIVQSQRLSFEKWCTSLISRSEIYKTLG